MLSKKNHSTILRKLNFLLIQFFLLNSIVISSYKNIFFSQTHNHWNESTSVFLDRKKQSGLFVPFIYICNIKVCNPLSLITSAIVGRTFIYRCTDKTPTLYMGPTQDTLRPSSRFRKIRGRIPLNTIL